MEFRHFCDDPVCPDPVWKLSTPCGRSRWRLRRPGGLRGGPPGPTDRACPMQGGTPESYRGGRDIGREFRIDSGVDQRPFDSRYELNPIKLGITSS